MVRQYQDSQSLAFSFLRILNSYLHRRYPSSQLYLSNKLEPVTCHLCQLFVHRMSSAGWWSEGGNWALHNLAQAVVALKAGAQCCGKLREWKFKAQISLNWCMKNYHMCICEQSKGPQNFLEKRRKFFLFQDVASFFDCRAESKWLQELC